MRPQVAATRLRWDKYRDACDDNDCHGMTLRQQQRNCSPPNYVGGSSHKVTHRIFHSLRGKLCIGIRRCRLGALENAAGVDADLAIGILQNSVFRRPRRSLVFGPDQPQSTRAGGQDAAAGGRDTTAMGQIPRLVTIMIVTE